MCLIIPTHFTIQIFTLQSPSLFTFPTHSFVFLTSGFIEKMAGAFDSVLAPAFTLSLRQESNSDSSLLFNLSDSPVKLRVSAAPESSYSLTLYQTKTWPRGGDDLMEVCERLNQRGREYHYAVGEPKAEGTELRVKGWVGHQINTKNWEPVLITLVDSMLRDFTLVERMLNDGNINLPLASATLHRFAELIWPVITYFSPKDYTLVCGESGSGHFSSNFDFSHNLKRVSSQRLKILFDSQSGNLRISLTHSEEGKVTKAKLKDLGLRSGDIKVIKGRLNVGTSIRLGAQILTGVLFVAQNYINAVGRLMEVGVLSGKLPFPAAKVLFKPEEDPDFSLFLEYLEQLRPNVFEVLSAFQPPPCPSCWTLPAFREVLLPDTDRCEALLSEFRTFCLGIRFAVPRVHPQLLHFDSDRRTVLTDLSGLQPIAEMQAGAKDSYTLFRYMTELLGTMTEMNKAGYEMTRVKSTWYENKYANSTVVMPDLARNHWSISIYKGGMGEDEGLEALSHLPPYLQPLGYEEALKLAEEIKNQENDPKKCRENALIVAGLTSGDRALAFFPTETSTILLNSLLRRLWFDCTKASIASPQSLSLIQILRPDGTTLGMRHVIGREAVSYAALPIDGKEQVLGHLYTHLERTQKNGIGHFMLRPGVVFLSEGTLKVRDPQFSVYRLRKLHGEQADLAMTELDYVDPSVLTYIYLKRSSASLKSQQSYDQSEAARLEAKCRKYFHRISPKCDIYSFAMFIYALIWPRNEPFSYVWRLEDSRGTSKLDGFYHEVVKLHRRPLIPEQFENAFPAFTETLRRCFMKPDCRPSLQELKLFVPQVPEFRKCAEILSRQ